MYSELQKQITEIFTELIEKASLKTGSIIVMGCSTSEICGEKIGTGSDYSVADALYSAFYPLLREKGIYLAAQCCEHLNRCLVVEAELAQKLGADIVNVIPQPKAGGSSATAAYKIFRQPVVIEHIKADAGIDIGGTLIGMHLKETAVPLRLAHKTLGNANIICARTRPKFVGGGRAVYDEELM